MTSRSYFGEMNSTLGSVVPLAMFDPMTTNWPTFYQGLDEGEERRRCSAEAQFSIQASYITSNHHQLPLDVDIAHEVVDLIRYDVRQCLFFGNHRLVVQGSDLLEGLGLSRRGG